MSIAPMRILMVNANRIERGQQAIMLARFNHGVVFSNGMIEINLDKLDKYDLIIVDEHLPEGAGIVLLHQMSAKIRSKTIYLSSGDEKERDFYKNTMGIYECMKKPVKPMDLAVVTCDFYVSYHFNDESTASLSC